MRLKALLVTEFRSMFSKSRWARFTATRTATGLVRNGTQPGLNDDPSLAESAYLSHRPARIRTGKDTRYPTTNQKAAGPSPAERAPKNP